VVAVRRAATFRSAWPAHREKERQDNDKIEELNNGRIEVLFVKWKKIIIKTVAI